MPRCLYKVFNMFMYFSLICFAFLVLSYEWAQKRRTRMRNLFRVSLVAQLVKNLPTMQEIQVRSLGGEDPWRRKWQPTPIFLPAKTNGQRTVVGYRSWGCQEFNITEQLSPNMRNVLIDWILWKHWATSVKTKSWHMCHKGT